MGKSDSATIFDTQIKEKHFEIDGVQVGGQWRVTDDSLDWMIDPNRNSPELLKALETKFNANPENVRFTVGFPLLKHESQAHIGYLTAGYLLWFLVLGYSWVLQKHLDPVRQQILNPNQEILNKNTYIKFSDERQWTELNLGFARIEDCLAMVVAYNNAIVFFPSTDSPDLYSKPSLKEAVTTKVQFLRCDFCIYTASVLCSYGNKICVCPNSLPALMDTGAPNVHVHFRDGESRPRFLHSISNEKAYLLMKEATSVTRLQINQDRFIDVVRAKKPTPLLLPGRF